MNFNNGFLKIPLFVLNSFYYRYVLSDTDKNILHYLWANVSIGSSKYYKNGLLVANIKEQTLIEKSGETYSTLIRHLKRLDYLGAAIKIRSKVKHNRYFVGFRTAENERLYLLYHLITEYNLNLERNISNQMDEFEKRWSSPQIKDISAYRIEGSYKKIIIDYTDRPGELLNKKVKDNKTLVELLFGYKNIYKKPLEGQLMSLQRSK